jgi:cellulose synthase/poly-beta-1,6-N-acetylglucosamine synthase-like glycosyltransferase
LGGWKLPFPAVKSVVPGGTSELDSAGEARLLDEAIHGLERAEPQFSARVVITPAQCAVMGLIALVIVAGAVFALSYSAFVLVILLGSWFMANAVFRAWLVWLGSDPTATVAPSPIAGEDVPLYSILVPLYREANIVPRLMQALMAIDYPRTSLEVLLLLEADDADTIAAVKTATLDERFRVVLVPVAQPRTKPKACNYALPLARGEFTVIYDAEDRPEPDQLRKAVAAFRSFPREVACLQARLNFFNAEECWLTKMFALDYSLWFDLMLPGLDRAEIPMPLGGTSNHFRTELLQAAHGWDPFNVTEDADLGIRLARLGLRVRTLDSTTFEEATSTFDSWLKQRTRWLKGYMQTWLVHMRDPRALLKHAGAAGFLAFQLFVGGTFISALLNPILWAIFLASKLFGVSILAAADAHFSFASLVIGNGLFAYLSMLGPFRRGWQELSPHGLLAPVYWLLISVAGYRALLQLFRHASLWEKTPHGLSTMVPK